MGKTHSIDPMDTNGEFAPNSSERVPNGDEDRQSESSHAPVSYQFKKFNI